MVVEGVTTTEPLLNLPGKRCDNAHYYRAFNVLFEEKMPNRQLQIDDEDKRMKWKHWMKVDNAKLHIFLWPY